MSAASCPRRPLPALLCLLLTGATVGPLLSSSDRAEARRRRRSRRAEPPTPPPYLATARRALAAGRRERAAKVLSAARRCWLAHGTRCGFTRGEFGALSGQIDLAKGHYLAAIRALRQATTERPRDQGSWFYLGQALYRAGQKRAAVKALERAPLVGRSLAGYFLLLARAQREIGAHAAARATLDRGLIAHPRANALWREVAALFQTVGLHEGALVAARTLAKAGASAVPRIHLSVAADLRRQRQRRAAILVLEEALLLHPDDATATARLAGAYAELGQHLSAARLLARLASTSRPDVALAAAEHYRLAGASLEALRWNRRVTQARARTLQRATIYLARQQFRRATMLLRPLWRQEQLTSPLRFRLAYAAVRSGQHGLALKVLKTLRRGPFAKPSAALGRLLKRCKARPWYCR